MSAETGGEMPLVLVAAGGGHEFDGQAGGHQQVLRMLETRPLQPVTGSPSCGRQEKLAQA